MIDLRKTLLAGTALVAVAGFAAGAQAQVAVTASDTYADNNAGDLDASNLTAMGGDALNVTADAVTITVTNDQTADDGNGLDSFNIGAVTDSSTATDATLAITSGNGTNLTVAVTSVAVGGNFTVIGQDGNDADIAVTTTGNVSAGGNLVVESDGDTQPNTTTLTVGGTLSVTGTTGVTAGDNAGNSSATLDVAGNATFGGAVTVAGGADAAAPASINLAGATNVFTTGLTLTPGVAGDAVLNIDGTTAQSVTGPIAGAGTIDISNIGGTVTLAGDSTHTGTLLVNGDDTANQAVVISGANASAIELGDGTGTETVALTLSGTGQVVSGGITGGATETTTVTVSGTVDQTAAAWEVSSVAVSGTLEMNQNITADAVSGSGTLDVDTNSSFIGRGTSTNLSVSNVTIADGVTLTVDAETNTADGTISSNILLEDDGTDNAGGGNLTIDNGGQEVTVSGNITTAFASEGDVVIATGDAATTNITGNIGTAAAAVETLEITDAGGNSALNVGGNLWVDAVTLGTDDVLTFTGTTQAVSGTITGTATNSIVVGNGTTQTPTVTLNGTVGTIATANVQAGSTLNFQGDATFTGAYTNAGTTRIGADDTLQVASVVDGGGTFTFDVNGTDIATFNDVANAAIDTDDVTFNYTGTITVASISGTDVLASGTFDEAKAATDNSALYNTSVATDGTVTVTANDITTLSSNSETSGIAAVANGLLASTDTEIDAWTDRIASAGSAADVDEVLESATPDVSAGAFQAGIQTVNTTAGITQTRLASLRDGSTGMTAGNISQGLSVWGQVFGRTGEQDSRDGVDGFDIDTIGFAAGIDTETLADGWVWGLGFSYANSEVDAADANSTETDIDSYQITLYADYELDDRTYVSGQLAYAFSDNEVDRTDVGGISGNNASGEYDADVFSARLEAGRDYEAGNGTTLTPSLLVNYAHYDADSYSETGAGGLTLSDVDSDSLNILEFGVGLDASWIYQQADGGYLKPSLSVGARYDVIGDELETTASLAGTSFKSEGFDSQDFTADLGAAVTYYSTTNWELTADYNFEYKEDYDAHSGFLRAAYKF